MKNLTTDWSQGMLALSFGVESCVFNSAIQKYKKLRYIEWTKKTYTLFTHQYLWNKLWQCWDADGGHFEHLHWIQNTRTSLISILLLYKYSSNDYRVLFFMSKCVYIFLGHSVYKTVMLPVVLYGCETWPFTLWEEYRLGGVQELGAEEHIWALEGWGNRGVQKIT